MNMQEYTVQNSLSSQTNEYDERSTKLYPFIKWLGGKTKYIDTIEKFFPNNFERYFEPFIGGGAMFLHLLPKKAYISDLNIELINCYQTIRGDAEGLIKELNEYHDKNKKDVYISCRKEFNHLKKQNPYSYDDAIEQGLSKDICVKKAGLFIFLNKTCFRGIYRENKSGEMNVPYGNYKDVTLYDINNIMNISKYLSSNDILIHHHSYDKIIPSMHDFVYLDPPYDQERSTDFVSYTKYGFNQEELYKFVTALSSRNILFVLSNAPTKYIKNLYKDYGQKVLSGKRGVDVKKIKTVKNIEIIIYIP